MLKASSNSRLMAWRQTRQVRLQVEALEERQLLTANTLPTLVDTSASGLIVQYRDQDRPTLVTIPAGASLNETLVNLRADARVAYAEVNHEVQLNRVPNDSLFGSLWGQNNTGQTIQGVVGVADRDIDAPEAWDVATGSSRAVVAVVDTGVDYRHPDLYLNIWINQGEIPAAIRSQLTDVDADGILTFYDLNNTSNIGAGKANDVNRNGYIDGGDLLATTATGGWADGVDTDGNGYRDDFVGWDFHNNDNNPLDDEGHGTHVAGTIGAVGNNGRGVTGVVWRTRIMALKFLDANGGGNTLNAVYATDYATNNGVRVSNHSWGGGGYSTSMFNAIVRARDAGHIFVAAAGNEASNNDQFSNFPSNYSVDNVVAVAATDNRGRLANFSNYGVTQVDLGAPGVRILSTLPNGQYGYLDGTSMATPQVTGAFALLANAQPQLSYRQAIDAVLQTGDVLTSLQGRTVTGRQLNVNNAVRQAINVDVQGAFITSMVANSSTSVTSVRVTFNEAINASTFTPSDVRLTSPSGTVITVTGVRAVGTTGREFDLDFAAQTTAGTYRLEVGPAVMDLGGNRMMDQDRDGVSGEASQDQFVGTFQVTPVYTYTSNIALSIVDGFRRISTITVDRAITLADVNVRLNISHTYVGDLRIYLRGPDGTTVLLVNQRGGAGDNFNNTSFDDQAGVAITAGAAPFAGTFRPEQLLSLFNGKQAQGQWQLLVDDLVSGDTGWLNSWSLTMQDSGGTLRRSVGTAPQLVVEPALGLSTFEASSAQSAPANPVSQDAGPLRTAAQFLSTPTSTPANGSAAVRSSNVPLQQMRQWAADSVFSLQNRQSTPSFTPAATASTQPLFQMEQVLAEDLLTVL